MSQSELKFDLAKIKETFRLMCSKVASKKLLVVVLSLLMVVCLIVMALVLTGYNKSPGSRGKQPLNIIASVRATRSVLLSY